MIDILQVNPGLWVILAGIICAFVPVGQIRKALVLLAPIFAGVMIFQIYGAQEVIGGRKLLKMAEGREKETERRSRRAK